MAPKASTQQRVWGTRFDTLPTTPPASPSTGEDTSHENTSLSDTSEVSNSPSNSNTKEERTPHEASIFVGSLPANIDQLELTRLLSDHLSEHTEIQNIKVVRDSKGGVCAFVQCEDAASAANLINTLQNRRNKTFLGRYLRYEPARAFRTLLISYRFAKLIDMVFSRTVELKSLSTSTPTQYTTTDPPSNHAGDHFSSSPQLVSLDLPFAMRVWRNPGSKFFTLSYNAEAITTEAQDKETPSSRISLLLNPLSFDEKSIKSITDYFGRLEHFIPYSRKFGLGEVECKNLEGYPSPHDVPRSVGMHSGCWEVKWKNRDDCVAALMTLRRVPHLTVTWAHQPSSPGSDHRSQFKVHRNATTYPFYVQAGDVYFPHNKELSASPQHDPFVPTAIDSSPICGRIDKETLDRVSQTIDDLSLAPTSERLDWSEAVVSPSALSHSREQSWKADTSVDLPEYIRSGEPEAPEAIHSSSTITANPHRPSVSAAIIGPARRFATGRSFREVDPTTLFVGGLENFGPSGWTEGKLTEFFKNYPGLEDIRMVQPQNGNTGFAFVKFSNTESPARAVLEQHNNVYEGRPMRVQLREVHSHRNYWRHNRGRGRFYSNLGGLRSISDHVRHITPGATNVSLVATTAPEGPPHNDSSLSPYNAESTASEPPAYSENLKSADGTCVASFPEDPLATLSPPQSPSHSPERIDSSLNAINPDWQIEIPQKTNTPTVQPLPNLAAAPPTFPYPPPTPYYHHSTWVHPYAPPVPYQMPYMAYPGLAHFGHVTQYPIRGPQPEAGSSGTPLPWPSPGPYGTHQARTPTNDHNQAQGFNTRAPLAPAGFIQNEQGTLIAVYQPEALDTYMSSQAPAADPQIPVGSAASSDWPQHPFNPGYHYSVVPHVPSGTQRSETHTPYVIHGPTFPGHQPSGSVSAGATSVHDIPGRPGQPGGLDEVDAGATSFHRRQSSRRDQHAGYSQPKVNNSYRFGNRQSRTGFQPPASRSLDNGYQTARRGQYHGNAPSEWHHWGNGQ